MLGLRSPLLSLSVLIASTQALTFTAPVSTVNVDATQEFKVSWTSDANDPQTIDLTLGCPPGSFCTAEFITLASDVRTSDGSVNIRPNAIRNGGEWVIQARNNGNIIATSSTFRLTADDAGTMSIQFPGTATSTSGSDTGSVPATPFPGTGTTSEGGSTVLTGTRTDSVIASNTEVMPTITDPTAATTSSSRSTSPTSTPNAQPRLGGEGNGMFLTVAGVLAGFVALVA